jgi:hypothetical protein
MKSKVYKIQGIPACNPSGIVRRLLCENTKLKVQRTTILPVVLHGRETQSLTLSKEIWLRLFRNRVLRKIFGAKSEQIMGDWRKVHSEELHDLYSVHTKYIWMIKSRTRWVGHVACREGK